MTQIYFRRAWMDLQVLVPLLLPKRLSVTYVSSAINYRDVTTQVKTVHRSKAIGYTKVHSHLDFYFPKTSF